MSIYNAQNYPSQYYDIQNGIPVLKAGYSTDGSIGGSKMVHTIEGTAAKYQRWGGGKDSYKWVGGTDPINIYQLPQQQAAPAPAPAPTPAPQQQLQISQASKDYRAETEALLAEATKQREGFAAEQVAAKKAAEIAEQTRLRTLRTAAANQERGAQGANLQIKPAPSTPQIGGTQPFKRRRNQFAINKPSYSGLSISQSGMVNV